MFAVRCQGDKVVIDLGGRRRDLLMSCGAAEEFENALRQKASEAERAPPELVKGEVWGARVESYDGYVCVRFTPPLGGNPTKVPLPPAAARRMADLVQFKRQQAAYKMRFEFRNGPTTRKAKRVIEATSGRNGNNGSLDHG